MYFDASIAPNAAPLRLNQRSPSAPEFAAAIFPRSYQYAAVTRKNSRNVSSLPRRLIAAAFTSNAQNTDAHNAVPESNIASGSKNTTPAVAAPKTALGKGRGGSGDTSRPMARRVRPAGA